MEYIVGYKTQWFIFQKVHPTVVFPSKDRHQNENFQQDFDTENDFDFLTRLTFRLEE